MMTHQFPGQTKLLQADDSDEIAQARIQRLLSGSQAALRDALALRQMHTLHRLALHHSHYNPNQPRVPVGHPDGGQRTRVGGGAGENDPRVVSDATPDDLWKPGARYATGPRRGSVPVRIGGRWVEIEGGQANRLLEAQARAQDAIVRVRALDPSWRPRPSTYESVEGLIRAYESEAEQAQARFRELAGIETSPSIPRQRPPTAQERNDVAREIARWLIRHRGHIVEGVSWLLEYEPSIEAYLDPPKTLEELQRAVSTPKKGYDIHHIVERTSAEQDGYPRSVTDGPKNLVRISRFKHWEITAWYMTKNKAFDGLSPRDHLHGKDWAERTRIGLRALIRHGVLKP
jgi:hypothetical protein